MTDRINTGDLTTSADIDRHDEIGQLADAINRLQKTLQGGYKMTAAAQKPSPRWGGKDTERNGTDGEISTVSALLGVDVEVRRE